MVVPELCRKEHPSQCSLSKDSGKSLGHLKVGWSCPYPFSGDSSVLAHSAVQDTLHSWGESLIMPTLHIKIATWGSIPHKYPSNVSHPLKKKETIASLNPEPCRLSTPRSKVSVFSFGQEEHLGDSSRISGIIPSFAVQSTSIVHLSQFTRKKSNFFLSRHTQEKGEPRTDLLFLFSLGVLTA